MKALEIRSMTEDEIRGKLGELKEEYFRLSFRNAVHNIENPLQLRYLRRDIARCRTVLREMEGQSQAVAQ
ncbi:MAG: 50S ribosomal protein L29 [Candidatus Glassbacteria bacterium]|nr:50S ribosomal protein L29 [Candidatus Glassbacteria bacterium]